MDRFAAVQVVDALLCAAIRAGASDVHLYLVNGHLEVSFRVGGKMVPFMSGIAYSEETVRRLKALGRMDVTVRHLPQEGSFQWMADGKVAHIRASSVPIFGGESVVLRLFHAGLSGHPLQDLGLSHESLSRVLGWLQRDSGLIALAGRTGAGKTTMAYAMLEHLLSQSRTVLTLEDPVEVRVPGCRQIEIQEKQGLTFDVALRAMVRQDPDAIFIGEVRDEVSAAAACRAAMTGRLVIVTVHARRPMGVTSRFLDFGVPASVLEEVLSGVVFVESAVHGGRTYRALGVERLFPHEDRAHRVSGRITRSSRVGKGFASAH
ncbi:ATPase, T2SS/T4P/T4SS family [Alicyclobacillus sendaiensis]|uniref:ATPase, T2SS/T4P/T4SS family n=1 Tax=Alicyclobacillus sendaiensis PA2 TaxID=3029425 RepID=A0ABT6XXS6_ALISE|nr:ATPase, T2SS/T4P/T4SS family [Alicyclobacillus sendaiensis]MDI9259878.1 ATPase, T2SS/T4P/T4SS family [Alicyclobacillus sendaiensis PA2]